MMVEPWILRAPPGVVAVETASGRLSYRELCARALAGADELLAGGVRQGDRVALTLGPGRDFVAAFWAIALAGAVVMPIDPRLGPRERAPLVASAGVRVEAPLADARKNAAIASGARNGTREHAPALEDPLMGVHTSGATGAPRPVELTYGNVLANALGCAVALGHDPGERWLCPLPLSHVGGLMVLLRSAIYGTTAVLGPPGRDDVTIASMVPTQLARLIEAGAQPGPRLRLVMLGGAAANPRLLHGG